MMLYKLAMWKASIDYLFKFSFACITEREFSILNGLWLFRTKKLNRLYIIEYYYRIFKRWKNLYKNT